MLITLLGDIEIYIDDKKVKYKEKSIAVSENQCPDVNGRYAIEVDFIPDGKTHVISCKIKGYILSKADEIESGERLELKSFYKENTKLSIGMEGEVGYYFDGTRSSEIYDYDNGYMENGVSYLIKEETKTTKYVFGVAWIENAITAAIEGAMALCMGIAEKRKSGKKFNAFDEDDWKEIAATTGKGTFKGGMRGASIYTLTNFTATPAAVASAMVTAAFGIAEQAYQLEQGNVDEQRFIENSEMLCLDASVSALSSFAGQVLIPVPVLGAVVGNTVGTMMYQIAKENLSSREQKIFEEYVEAVRKVDVSLQAQYQKFVDEIGKDTKLFMELLDRAFAPDIRVAFEGSIDLAKSCGVPVDEILDSKEKIASYFMD